MKEKINPVGLKGYEITERMKELMGMRPIVENRKTSVVELSKLGPDGNVYGIVRENHEYYIKVTPNKKDIVVEDFSYIGGLKNKKDEAYHSYANALKHLNLKFNSLNEAYGTRGGANIFENDNLVEDVAGFYQQAGPAFKNEGNLDSNPKSKCCQAPIMDGLCSECGKGGMYEEKSKDNPWAICTSSVGREDKDKYESCVRDVKKEKGIKEEITEADFNDASLVDHGDGLSEKEQAVEDMNEQKVIKKTLRPKPKLSIETSINEMDNIIDDMLSGKKKA